jgi:hypothetical protein
MRVPPGFAQGVSPPGLVPYCMISGESRHIVVRGSALDDGVHLWCQVGRRDRCHQGIFYRAFESLDSHRGLESHALISCGVWWIACAWSDTCVWQRGVVWSTADIWWPPCIPIQVRLCFGCHAFVALWPGLLACKTTAKACGTARISDDCPA